MDEAAKRALKEAEVLIDRAGISDDPRMVTYLSNRAIVTLLSQLVRDSAEIRYLLDRREED